MRKLIVITQLSIDGVMQAPGGPDEDRTSGFGYGGWAMPFGDEIIGKALNETTGSEHDLLLGRRTYDIFSSYWPQHEDTQTGQGFGRATKYVITHRDEGLTWKTSHRVTGGIDGVRRLKTTGGPDLHVWGSHDVLQPMITAGLVDEYRLWIAPVMLGTGKRLFEGAFPAHKLTLVETIRSSTGVLLNTYRPTGPLPKA